MAERIVPFNKPMMLGPELDYIRQAVESGVTSGDGVFTRRCTDWIKERYGIPASLMVTSGTSALDLLAASIPFEPGDEVITTSYTFVATANAFVRLGVRPVFVEINPKTMNLDETKIESAITPRTKAIVPVHYNGIACAMDVIEEIARRHGLLILEDAAQGVEAFLRGRPLGTFGSMAIYSFHEAKNVNGGQAGALLFNDERFLERAEILRDKGTNRAQFFRGQVQKYEWLDVGVAHALSEINAAYLYAQLERIEIVNEKRRALDNRYRELLGHHEQAGRFKIFEIPEGCETNYHIFWMMMPSADLRHQMTEYLRSRQIWAPFHYIPLHTAPMGAKLGFQPGDLPITEDAASRLIRLPMYFDLTDEDQVYVAECIDDFYAKDR